MLEKLVRKACEALSKRLPARLITNDDGSPYLERFFVYRRKWGVKILPSVYLHRFHSSDEGRDLHNHPWRSSLSFVLAGGYREFRLMVDDEGMDQQVVEKLVKPFSFNWITSDDYHRVELLEADAWSLFFAGKRTQDWGFWLEKAQEHVPWKSYLAARRERKGLAVV